MVKLSRNPDLLTEVMEHGLCGHRLVRYLERDKYPCHCVVGFVHRGKTALSQPSVDSVLAQLLSDFDQLSDAPLNHFVASGHVRQQGHHDDS